MAHATFEERLSLLEKTVRDLATRQDLEEVQERLREEIRSGDERTRLDLEAAKAEIAGQILETREQLREEIRLGDERTRLDLHAVIEERTAEIMSLVSTGNDETRRYMRVLYEDVIGRIARLQG